MYGVLGEDDSDFETLKVFIKRLANNDRLRVTGNGFGGGPGLVRKGARAVKAMVALGTTHFVICHDSDGKDPVAIHEILQRQIVTECGVPTIACTVVPVQEIEAWLLADIQSATKQWTGWHPRDVRKPEEIASPKEYLEGLSREGVTSPRYAHATHNPVLAGLVDLGRVEAKCGSAAAFFSFVRSHSSAETDRPSTVRPRRRRQRPRPQKRKIRP